MLIEPVGGEDGGVFGVEGGLGVNVACDDVQNGDVCWISLPAPNLAL